MTLHFAEKIERSKYYLPSRRDCHREVFVKGFPDSVDKFMIEQFFSEVGPVKTVSICYCRKPKFIPLMNRNRFAFVHYHKKKIAMQAAEVMNGKMMGDSVLRVRMGKTRKEVLKFKKKINPETSKHRNLFISGLPACCGEHDVYLLFSKFGPIVSCAVMNRGVAVCLFKEEEHAYAAIQAMNGALIYSGNVDGRQGNYVSANAGGGADGSEGPSIEASKKGEGGHQLFVDFLQTATTRLAQKVRWYRYQQRLRTEQSVSSSGSEMAESDGEMGLLSSGSGSGSGGIEMSEEESGEELPGRRGFSQKESLASHYIKHTQAHLMREEGKRKTRKRDGKEEREEGGERKIAGTEEKTKEEGECHTYTFEDFVSLYFKSNVLSEPIAVTSSSSSYYRVPCSSSSSVSSSPDSSPAPNSAPASSSTTAAVGSSSCSSSSSNSSSSNSSSSNSSSSNSSFSNSSFSNSSSSSAISAEDIFPAENQSASATEEQLPFISELDIIE